VDKENAALDPSNDEPAVDAPRVDQSLFDQSSNDEPALNQSVPHKSAFNETALVEAVLYMETNPVTADALARITGLSEDAVSLALSEIGARCKEESSGIDLLETASGYLFSPKQDYWEVLREHYGKKNRVKLSRAAIETLTIIAYMQPVTRAEIEQIRGVNVDNMIRLLLERNLIREAGKKDAPGKPVQYGTTKEFLDVFHLASIADLPRLAEQDAEKFELEDD
jgi:segregation and condensation protein B